MRTTSRKIPLGTGAAVAAAVVLIALALVFRHGASGLLMRAAAPVLAARNALFATDSAELRAELASTTAALADRDLLYAENQELRAELGRVPAGSRELLVGVLERPPGTPYDTFLIDAGSAQGVAVGQEVSVGPVAVGAVDTVYSGTARVALYSSPGFSYHALIQTSGGSVPVVVEGQGAGSLDAQVPWATPVAVGDPVVLPGVAGPLTAKVSAVESPEGASSKTVYLNLPFDLFSARFVFVHLP